MRYIPNTEEQKKEMLKEIGVTYQNGCRDTFYL